MLDGAFHIRCTLPLAIQGSDEIFAFGPWARISEEDFRRYVESWQADDCSDFPHCSTWLMNDLPGTGMTDRLLCDIDIGDGARRPQISIQPDTHALARMQRDGITFDQLLDIYAAAGQDHRPHLGDP